MPPPAIDVQNLVKAYAKARAVDGISFAVEPGTVVGLLGGNGAGKTTTLSIIMGLILPSSGTVRVLGSDMTRDRRRVLARLNFQSPYVDMPGRLTVRQNLGVFARLYGVRRPAERVASLAERLDLADFLDKPVSRLSAGQKTRASLAKAFVNEPELLVLDEPTASLDPDTADWVRSYLDGYRLERNATILLASHNMLEVERLCDRVIMMRRGAIVDDDTPAALLERYARDTLEDVFLDIARGREAGDAA